MIKKIILIIALCLPNLLIAQTMNNLKKIEKRNEVCFKKADACLSCMVRCLQIRYDELDTLLNSSYKKILGKLSEPQKSSFKNEQVKWLKTRDKEFKKLEKDQALVGGTRDVITEQMGDFIRKRVIILITKLNKI